MIYILPSGIKTQIDSEDYELIKDLNWVFDGNYIVNRVRYGPRKENKVRKTYLHRHIMGLKTGDGLVIDHINRDKLNNQKSNLRIVTALENAHNKGKMNTNTSGYPGVYWFKPAKLWCAYITYKGKKYSRYAKTIDEAIRLRKQLGEDLLDITIR